MKDYFVMTPLQLRLIIQAYTSPSYEGIESLRNNSTWQDQFRVLQNDGLIVMITHDLPKECDWPYQLSEKGEFWFNHIMSTPFPISEWKIPKCLTNLLIPLLQTLVICLTAILCCYHGSKPKKF